MAENDDRSLRQLVFMASQRLDKGMNITIGEAILEGDLTRAAVALAGHSDKRIAFRVSWGMEYAYFRDRDRFRSLIPEIIRNYICSDDESIHRIYGKIVFDMLRRKARPAIEKEKEIADKAFDLLVSDKVKVASKVWAMEILLLLSDRIPWIAENLAATIEHQASLSPTPAMTNHAGKVLKRIGNPEKKRPPNPAVKGTPA